MTRILVCGVPRSGSTWLAELMGETDSSVLLLEPDNHARYPFALRAKQQAPGGFYPILRPSDSADQLERLWSEAFGGAGFGWTIPQLLRHHAAIAISRIPPAASIRRAFVNPPPALHLRLAERLCLPERPTSPAQNVIVKSVFSALCVEWIVARTGAQVVVLLRDLKSVVSSWLQLGWLTNRTAADDELACTDRMRIEARASELGAPLLGNRTTPLARLTWLLGVLTVSLERSAAINNWSIVRHDELVVATDEELMQFVTAIGLMWTEQTQRAMETRRKFGTGYATNRTPEQLREAWKLRMSSSQINEVDAVLADFSGLVR